MVNARSNEKTSAAFGPITEDEPDISLLEDSLAKTPWERMQANDDALRFADSLRAANAQTKCKTLAS
jgi:hypothetical protein